MPAVLAAVLALVARYLVKAVQNRKTSHQIHRFESYHQAIRQQVDKASGNLKNGR